MSSCGLYSLSLYWQKVIRNSSGYFIESRSLREIHSHQKESDDAEALYIPCSYSDPDRILILSAPGPGGYTHAFRYACPCRYRAAGSHDYSYGYNSSSASYDHPVCS